jgi:hypothetical protein
VKLISIVTIDPTGHPHASLETMERMAKLNAEMRAEGALIDTGGLDALGSNATCYLHEVSPTP